MSPLGGQPAFPESILSNGAGQQTPEEERGLTKREYFAVHLFDGAIAKLSVNCSLLDKARYAVEAADALCQALEEKQGQG